MSKVANSPTARLLQSSRLFSLPRSLPEPQLGPVTSTGIHRASDSATLPYPILQAIATPSSSQFRGDWGLKRPLPSRATKDTNTPHIRVYANDTREQVTDFISAADHTQTSAKWKEMGIAVFQRGRRQHGSSSPTFLSAFEPELDSTVRESVLNQPPHKSKSRWKFQGPWIAGMQKGEFENYIVKAIENRRGEWREYVRKRKVDQRVAEAVRHARDSGKTMTALRIQQLEQELRPSDDELNMIFKDLRDQHTKDALVSELTTLISQFLDLPSVKVSSSASASTQQFNHVLTSIGQDRDVANAIPPSTHASAGLSYVRTSALIENHPLYGPQGRRKAVPARIVQPRASSLGSTNYAKLGVGGVVLDDTNNRTHTDAYDTRHLNINADGGNKIWVHPEHATIDSRGRINLSVARAIPEFVSVANGDVAHIHKARAASMNGPDPADLFHPLSTQHGFKQALKQPSQGFSSRNAKSMQ